jgi:hypothetical protein
VIRSSRLATAGYLLLVFLSGALVGGFAYRLYSVKSVNSSTDRPRSPEEYRNRYIQEMTTQLKLDQAQVQSLQQIMDQTRQQYHDLRQQIAPQMKALEDGQSQKIRAMLNDTQRVQYEKMRLERERHRLGKTGGPK